MTNTIFEIPSMRDLQLAREKEESEMGRLAFESMLTEAVSKQREGSAIYGIGLMKDAFETVKPFIQHYITEQEKTRRKSALYVNLVKPALETTDKEEIINVFSFMFVQVVVNKFSNIQYLTPIATKMYKNISRSLCIFPDEELDKSIITSFVSLSRHLVETIEWLELKTEPRYKENGIIKGGMNYVEATQEKQEEMRAAMEKLAEFQVYHRPMLTLPRKHKNLVSPYGGFLSNRSPLLKKPTKVDGKIHPSILAFTSETNPEFFNTINHHQEVPYQINRRLLDAIPTLIEAGVNVDKLDYDFDAVLQDATKEAAQAITDANNERVDAFGENAFLLTDKQEGRFHVQAEMKSKQAIRLFNDTIKAATEYAEFERFYFPCYLDNRARIYYYSKTLQPQGSELHKALLQFADSALMTDETVEESFMALGNALGYDKMTVEYRTAKAKELLPVVMTGDVVEIVKHLDSESALTGLAIALDIKAYYDAKEAGVPYYTHQPLHVDSCNSGSQINGLLLRDKRNCELSNILNVDGDELADTYKEVAILLKNKMEQDDSGVYNNILAHSDIFNRKVFKKSSMTRSNYDASFLTCSDDIKYMLKTNHREAWDSFSSVERKMLIKDAVDAVDASLPASNNYKEFAKKLVREAVKRDGVLAYTHPRTGFPVVLKEEKVEIETVMYRELFTGSMKSFNFINTTGELDVNGTVSSCVPSIK